MFDYFKSLFDDFFGGDDDEDDEDADDWSPFDPDSMSWSPETRGEDLSEFLALDDRLIDVGEAMPGTSEFVNEYYTMEDALAYVEGTPENVLKIMLDPQENIYYVYRFPSE